MARADVLIVSLGSTAGLRAADAELRGALERVGARVALAAAAPQRDVRTLALTDLLWARAAPPPRAPLFASTSCGDHLLDDDRGAPVAGARRDSLRRPVGRPPPRPPRRLAAPGRAPPPATRRCWCRGRPARWRRRHSRTRPRSS